MTTNHFLFFLHFLAPTECDANGIAIWPGQMPDGNDGTDSYWIISDFNQVGRAIPEFYAFARIPEVTSEEVICFNDLGDSWLYFQPAQLPLPSARLLQSGHRQSTLQFAGTSLQVSCRSPPPAPATSDEDDNQN